MKNIWHFGLIFLLSYATVAEVQQRVLHETASTSELLQLHKDLVQLESITGGEASVADYLTSYLTKHKFTVERQVVESTVAHERPRENILAYLGAKRKTRILVSSHIDTVPPYLPYERRGDEIWGRGTVDAKGCVATQITAVNELLASGILREGELGLLFVVGEEVDGAGMRHANEWGLQPEVVIFGEPTELKLASGHKGLLRMSVSAKGKTGHSGYPWLARSANSDLIAALYALQNARLPSDEKYGNTTINIGKMSGGVAGNVIAEYAEADIVIRVAAGTPEELKRIIKDTLNEIGDHLSVSFSQGYAPVFIDSDVEGRARFVEP